MLGTLRPMAELGCALTAARDDVNAWEFRVSMEAEQVPDGSHVGVLQVDVHAASRGDAERLATTWGIARYHRLQLTECEDHGMAEWRTWVGWAPQFSQALPVSLAVSCSAAASCDREEAGS